MKKVGMSFKIDEIKRDKFNKVSEYKNMNMAAILKICIDDYIEKHWDSYVKSAQLTFEETR